MASFKHRGNGKVQITITYGKRFDGKPNRFYREVDYSTKKQLELDSALFYADVVNGKVAPANNATVRALWSDFISNYRPKKALSKSTVARYSQIYNNQIGPYLGKRKVNAISRSDVRDWINALLAEGNTVTHKPLEPKTAQMALSLLSTMYSYAIYDLEIAEKNPCVRIAVQPNNYKKTGTGSFESVALSAKKADRYYTKEELHKLLSLLLLEIESGHSSMHAILLHLIIFTGMRNGEVMGLKWDDIDFAAKTVYIQRERLYVSTVGIVTDTPKTESSIRKISVPTFIMQMLSDLKAEQSDWKEKMGSSWTETGYVAINPNGTPQHPRTVYKWFVDFQAKHGLKKATIHDLRHTHAAILSAMGTKIIDVSKRLGHTNTRITQEIYEYLFDDIDDSISYELDRYYKNVVKL